LPEEGGYRAKEMSATRILPSRAGIREGRRPAQQARPSVNTPTVLAELGKYYDALFRAHGQQHWWPGRTRFEVIVGAILTQNTSWTNVERAIGKLRGEKLLSIAAMERVPEERLVELVRSSGYFRQKARKLKEFVRFVGHRYGGSLERMFAVSAEELRRELLGVHGIGPETADSILLYAGGHAVFVVDAYTRRILQRHGLIHGKETYEEIRGLFERSLPADAEMFNEYHALIVKTGKEFCWKKEAKCEGCALREFLPESAIEVSHSE
jgi:endonuclease III related protein